MEKLLGVEKKATTEARQELQELRSRAAILEAQLRAQGVPEAHAPRAAAQQAVSESWNGVRESVAPVATQPEVAMEAVTLELAPEEHDARMGELIHILQTQGVAVAIGAAEATGSVHLMDDFHRILVEWVREGLPAKGSNAEAYKMPLSMTLFEVTMPPSQGEEMGGQQRMRDFISLMEQFYRGMQQMSTKEGEYFSFEIANPAGSVNTSVYVAVPSARKELFEKQLVSLFPGTRLVEKHDDYNAFAEGAASIVATATTTEKSIFSLRTYAELPNDPTLVLLNAFSKLDKTGEGAAIQFVISPSDSGMLPLFRAALERIQRGTPIEAAADIKTGGARVFHDFFVDPFFPVENKKDAELTTLLADPRVKNIERKLSSPIFSVAIRAVASASSPERARAILDDIEAPFQQLADTNGNAIKFVEVPQKRTTLAARAFSYRLFEKTEALFLSTAELATMAHVPGLGSEVSAPELQQEKSVIAPPPSQLPSEGAIIGRNVFRGSSVDVRIAPEDRLRHLYVIGQTGTGKSTLLKNVILQDILSGAGVCMIDPHGSDVLDILSAIPPERMDDVIYFDPGATEYPMGLNMLEYDPAHPEQKTLVVDELLGIFKKLFGAVPESMGPAFEQYFRNAALLVMEDPLSGNTLLDIARVFSDDAFRATKLAACKNPIVERFWQDIALRASGDQGLENYAPYVTNKFDVFTSNEIVRPIIAQQKSAFNFRELMDTRKILLVNLAKGRVGDLNANLLGLIIVGKFLIAALSRADSMGKELPPFYLHIDEFQNFTTPAIATIFSEARKYKLSLTVAHQFIAQLTDTIRDAVFGNVGSIAAFRVGAADAEYLEKQFAPTFTASDLMNIDNRKAYVKLLVDGKPATPFNIETLPFIPGDMERVERMRELSYMKYGKPRAEVEADISARLAPSVQNPTTLAG